MICGVCKKRDVDIIHVKMHHSEGGTITQGSLGPAKYSEATHGGKTEVHTCSEPAEVQTKDVPPGRYALETDIWRFYLVDDGKGRWQGYKFVSQLIGSPGSYRKEGVKDKLKREMILADIAQDVRKAAIDYGIQTEQCSVCGSDLSNPESIAAGIGPVCAGKRGW